MLVLGVSGLLFGVYEGADVSWRGFGAIVMSVVGLVGAALAIAKPRIAAVLMMVSAVLGFVFVTLFYSLATVLLLVATLLAFLGREGKTVQNT